MTCGVQVSKFKARFMVSGLKICWFIIDRTGAWRVNIKRLFAGRCQEVMEFGFRVRHQDERSLPSLG